jgi:phosphoesterase RecJ-like protein
MKGERKKIYNALRQYSRFVVTSHQNIDGDGLGSALAVYFLLQRMGKEALVVYDGRVPYFYRFLPGAESVLSFDDFQSLGGSSPEALIVVDCSSLSRLGRVEELEKRWNPFVVNIDHHPDNTLFGHANFVDPSSPASALLVYDLVCGMEVPLDAEMATNILTGLVTDTGGFQFAELDPSMFQIVGELVASGASLSLIMRYAFRYRRLEALRLLSRALERLVFEPSSLCAITYLTREDFRECEAKEEDTEGIVDYGLYIPEAEVSVFLKEVEPGMYKVSLRSRSDFDVLSVARHFGGGGHRKAAGFKMAGTLSSVYHAILEYMRSTASSVLSLKAGGGQCWEES